MKALTLTQPWATLVAIGAKRFETRDWSTGYRGPLLIHAAKNWKHEDRLLCHQSPFQECLRDAGIEHTSQLPFGSVVATAMLVLVVSVDLKHFRQIFDDEAAEHEYAFGNYSSGRFAWRLERVQPLQTPIPCRGMLGLWTPSDDVIAAVREQLRSAAPCSV